MSQNNNCLLYYARLDPENFVQPGTMQGFNPGVALPCGQECEWVKLPTTQMTLPTGCTKCTHSSNLRFFYRKVAFSNPVTLQPNSLIASYDFPKTPNDCNWLEWFKECCS